MAKQYYKYAKRFLPIIGIFLFIFTVYQLGIQEIYDAILSVPPIFILIALPFTIPRILVRNLAWQMIQKEQEIHIPFWQSLKIFLIGYFYGSITPGYVGQLMRIPYMNEYTKEPYGKLFVNSFLETTLHTISLYAMIFIGALLVISTFPSLLYLIVIWILVVIIIFYFFMKKERGEKVFRILISYLIPKKIKGYCYDFVNTFYNDIPKIRRLIAPTLVAMITWFIIFSQEYLIVIALDLPIPYFSFLLLFPIANAAGFLPITFAGLGTREIVAVVLFSTLFGVNEALVFVVSLLGFIVTDIFTGFLGLIVALIESRRNPMKNKGFLP